MSDGDFKIGDKVVRKCDNEVGVVAAVYPSILDVRYTEGFLDRCPCDYVKKIIPSRKVMIYHETNAAFLERMDEHICKYGLPEKPDCERWLALARLAVTRPALAPDARLREALERICDATPKNTNSPTAESMASWCHAVARCALDDVATAAPPSASATPVTPPPGADDAAWRDVLAERRRQVEVEGWTLEFSDSYELGEIGIAAALHALPYEAENAGEKLLDEEDFIGLEMTLELACEWRIAPEPDKRLRLVKAGALILAEIERLDRAGGHAVSEEGA